MTQLYRGAPPLRVCDPQGRDSGQRRDEPVSVFQVWWASHVFVLETSTRYAHPLGLALRAPCQAFGSGAFWEPGSPLGSCPHPLPIGREGPKAVARGASDHSCLGPGAQVLLRLGRQRWKLRGRIESDDSQTWDEEEKAFIPTLHENFEIKVGGPGAGAGGGRASSPTTPPSPR